MNKIKDVKLDKGFYNVSGKTFSQILEDLDPSFNYKNTGLDNLDAFERQLKKFDIKIFGKNSDCVEKFFRNSNSATLFPEYVARAVVQGAKEANMLNDIVATNTIINTLDYRSVTSIPNEKDKELKKVAEGAVIPETYIQTQKNLVNLIKRGRILTATYEAIKFQRLDLFTVTLKQIGAYIAKSQFKDLVNVCINGDGNNNPAEVISVETSGKLTYEDLINLWSKFENYDMTHLIVSPDVMVKLLSIPELKDPATGLNFQATGTLSTPLGAVLVKSTAVPAGTIIALDNKCAIEKVTASEVLLENDKLIDRQLERTSITTIAGFAKIFADSVKVMKV